MRKIIINTLLLSVCIVGLNSCSFLNKAKEKVGIGSNKGSSVDDPFNGISNGQLVTSSRKEFKAKPPEGMVEIPAGSFTMGQADEDILSSRVSMNKRITIASFYMDDTEITNNEYRMFTNSMFADSASVLGEEFIKNALYPDTLVWEKDFTYHNGDQLTENYFSNPAFDNYPVVGVDWKAANYFCKWRSSLLNTYNAENDEVKNPSFRLPSEAEWEWAARGGKEGAKYPWGNPYVANSKGCYLANFKPNRGSYQKDGYQYTAPAVSFNANDFGLYNMAGNVAEWVQDAYSESYMPVTWDLNPVYYDPDEPRKVIKGGSWKDVAYFLETGTTTWAYETDAKSYIGFRCVMGRLGSYQSARK